MKIKIDRKTNLPVLPKKIVVGGRVFTVSYPYEFKEVGDHAAQLCWDTGELRIGITDADGRQCTPYTICSSFLHEVLHIIEYFTGQYVFHERDSNCEYERDKEDCILMDSFTEVMMSLLIQNKWVVLE